MFQSTPGNYAGRITLPGIPAGRFFKGFNPLPAIMPGESRICIETPVESGLVSIHSRQLCRENLARTSARAVFPRGFNPLPAIMPGESSTWIACVRRSREGFNPLPAIMPGESFNDADAMPRENCFNPLPAIMPGESL